MVDSEQNKNNNSGASFGQFGKSFQEKLCQALLVDGKFAEQMMEVVDISYFEVNYLKFLAERYFAYSKKYKVFPTLQLLVTIIRDDLKVGTDIILRDQIIDYLQRMKSNPDPGDLQYIKDRSLEFCRKQALKKALENAVDQMQANKYESIVETIKRAVQVGTAPSVGHDFFNEMDARFTKLKRDTIPTRIPELDKKEILNGGSGKGELLCVVGASGSGKSHWLTMIGANALREGKNVLHYTFELSETAVGIRYDSNLCDIDSNEVMDRKEDVKKYYEDNRLGRLFIKEYPTNTASIYTIRSHIERLDLKGFKPDIIIIDYADIMRSTRQFDSLRHELKLVYEELRGLAMDLQVPIWTASQSNKEGANAEVIDMTNMSEAYGKAMICDLIVSVSRRPHEKASGWGRLYVAKNRAGRDGLIFPIKMDTARSKFEVTGDSESPDQASTSNEEAQKQALRQKWKELKKEFPNGKSTSEDSSVASSMTM
jgi:replicative DNA helicase